MRSGCCDACEGQALALRAPRRVFFVARGPVSRDCSLILAILAILAILLQTIAIKVLTDLFSLLRLRSIAISRNTMTRSARTLICSGGWGACEGQALALQGPGRVFFVARGPVPRTFFL